MGSIGTYGNKNTAPEYHCSMLGTPSWSGKHESQIDEDIQQNLNSFIRIEARRKGNNDFVQNCIGENKAFFHPEFLNGWPHKLWLEHYEIGANEARNRIQKK